MSVVWRLWSGLSTGLVAASDSARCCLVAGGPPATPCSCRWSKLVVSSPRTRDRGGSLFRRSGSRALNGTRGQWCCRGEVAGTGRGSLVMRCGGAEAEVLDLHTHARTGAQIPLELRLAEALQYFLLSVFR